MEVKRSYYSVPPEYLGHEVCVRWDGGIVRVFNDRNVQIALHPRVRIGTFHTDRTHIPDEKISGVERGVPDMLRRAVRTGENAEKWSQALLVRSGGSKESGF